MIGMSPNKVTFYYYLIMAVYMHYIIKLNYNVVEFGSALYQVY